MLNQYRLFAVFSFSLLFGCAHPINIAANPSSLDKDANQIKKINVVVGYHIPSSLKTMEITTGGGGGDSIRYFAYQDLEFGYQRVLTNIFSKSVKIDSADQSIIKDHELDYVLVPTIVTSSGSTSFLTWPPTNFVVDLTTAIKDKSGNLVSTKRVVGNGVAEFSEFKSEHGLAGRRAMEDALLKMQESLLDTNSWLKTQNYATPISNNQLSLNERLKKIKELNEAGLISKTEYHKKRQEIFNGL